MSQAASFPKIVISPKRWKGHLAVYDEKSEPRKIILSEALKFADRETQKYVVLHEIGHWFRQEHVPGRLKRKAEELFAHAFASFMLKPKAFAATDPTEHAKISALVEVTNRRKLSAFANKMLHRLDR